MRLLDLPDALRDQGVEPVLVAGWQTRGGDFAAPPRLHLRHWTAGARTGVTPSLHTVTFGRADLPYNLCQTLQSREGGTKPDKAYVVSAGMAMHAGTGRWGGVDRANSYGTGNEIDWSGPAEAFPANRIETSVRIAAAFQSLHPDPQGKFCCEHREYATPAGRKQDTNLDGAVFRRDVDAHLHGGTPPTPAEDDDMAPPEMFSMNNPDRPELGGHVYITTGITAHYLGGAAAATWVSWGATDKTSETVDSRTFHVLDGPLKTP